VKASFVKRQNSIYLTRRRLLHKCGAYCLLLLFNLNIFHFLILWLGSFLRFLSSLLCFFLGLLLLFLSLSPCLFLGPPLGCFLLLFLEDRLSLFLELVLVALDDWCCDTADLLDLADVDCLGGIFTILV
jgi:hypothetical protein